MAARQTIWRPVLAVVAACRCCGSPRRADTRTSCACSWCRSWSPSCSAWGVRFIRDFAPLAHRRVRLRVGAHARPSHQPGRVLPASARRRPRDRARPHAHGTPPGMALRRAPALARPRADLPALAALRRAARGALRRLAQPTGRSSCRVPRRCSRRRSPRPSGSSSSRLPRPGWRRARGCCTASCASARSTASHEAHGTLQKLFDDNPVAAVPSLHAAYSLLVVLIVRRIWPRLTPLP